MRRSLHKATFVAFTAFTAAVVVGSLAWACTATSSITLATDIVSPRRQVALSAETISPGVAEIRWNSMDGPVLGTTTVPEGRNTLSADFIVPDVAPGVYYVLLVPGNNVVARAAIQVTADNGTEGGVTSSDLWNGFADVSGLEASEGTDRSASQNPSAGLLAGLGIAAFGTVALGGSAALLITRRRRPTAHK